MNEYTIPFRETEDDVIDKFLRRLQLSNQDMFLDIGCGNGIVIEKVAKQYPNVPCVGIEIDPAFANPAIGRLSPYKNAIIYTKDLRQMNWSELPVCAGILYCFVAWTKQYVESFDFQQLGEKVVWISFKHQIPGRTFTEKIPSRYPYNVVYVYRP